MNIYTPLSFLAFMLSIYMGVYVMRLNSRSASNRVFLGLTITTAIWNFANMFLFADVDLSNVQFWYKVSALGWANLPAFVLHFFLLLSQKQSLFKKTWIWILIYMPALIFTIRAMLGGFLAKDFEVGPGNAIYVIQNSSSLWYSIYSVYLIICIISGVLIFAFYGKRNKIKKVKAQSRIFLIAVFVLFIVIFITDLLLPILNLKIFPSIGGIIMIFWMLTIWYAIVKYKLMAFTVESAANELISEMKELLFFVDTESKVIRVNNFTEASLGMSSEELINTNFYELTDENQKVKNILENIEQVNSISDLILNLKCTDEKMLPANLSFSRVEDKTGDLLGTLIVGHDISLTIQLQKEIEQRKDAELQIKQQNETLIKQKEELQTTLANLKDAQAKLIQSEKMASLGELTAGIAHEIQNPLNFVNNFSEVSKELVDEMSAELANDNFDEASALADDIKLNIEKIIFHGKRADAIVKGMLQHSRSSNGKKEPTDINALADEYLRLAYYGLRAKDKDFNATLKTDFDETIGKISIVPQDIGRVILNLITNAFYACAERRLLSDPYSYRDETSRSMVDEKQKSNNVVYEPVVSVSSKRSGEGVEITVRDNGNGIPRKNLDKIFQPFFTTKPTGQGTGLGLSISYDIITKGHGGELKMESREGEGTTFIVYLPD